MTPLRCCRCGDEPRHLDTFLCKWCLRSNSTEMEWKQAVATSDAVTEQRAFLVRRWTWAGGWRKRAA